MKLVDFLVSVLETQAKTLQRLEIMLGQEVLLEILENMDESLEKDPFPFKLKKEWFEEPQTPSGSNTYSKLEGHIHDLGLPSVLEFHLWAFPLYRFFAESSVHPKANIRTKSGNAPELLAKQATDFADYWLKKLSLPPQLSATVEKTAFIPWLRFRAEFLKKSGKRPMSSV